jgi:hypothetical protein
MRALILLLLLLSGCSLVSGGPSASLDGQWQLQAGTDRGQTAILVEPSRSASTSWLCPLSRLPVGSPASATFSAAVRVGTRL